MQLQLASGSMEHTGKHCSFITAASMRRVTSLDFNKGMDKRPMHCYMPET